MRIALSLFFFVLLSLFIESTFLARYLANYLVPQLTAISIVYLVFSQISVRAVLLTFIFGLLVDLGSGLLLGPHAAGYVVSYVALSLLSKRLFLDSSFVVAIVSFLAVLLADLTVYIISFQFRDLETTFFLHSLSRALITALCAPFVITLLRVFIPVRKQRVGVAAV